MMCLFAILISSLVKCVFNLGRTDIFPILSLPIHEHSISLHLVRFFDSFLQCSVTFWWVTDLIHVFVKCIPKYYILSSYWKWLCLVKFGFHLYIASIYDWFVFCWPCILWSCWAHLIRPSRVFVFVFAGRGGGGHSLRFST